MDQHGDVYVPRLKAGEGKFAVSLVQFELPIHGLKSDVKEYAGMRDVVYRAV